MKRPVHGDIDKETWDLLYNSVILPELQSGKSTGSIIDRSKQFFNEKGIELTDDLKKTITKQIDAAMMSNKRKVIIQSDKNTIEQEIMYFISEGYEKTSIITLIYNGHDEQIELQQIEEIYDRMIAELIFFYKELENFIKKYNNNNSISNLRVISIKSEIERFFSSLIENANDGQGSEFTKYNVTRFAEWQRCIIEYYKKDGKSVITPEISVILAKCAKKIIQSKSSKDYLFRRSLETSIGSNNTQLTQLTQPTQSKSSNSLTKYGEIK